jgi:hypothetical protein
MGAVLLLLLLTGLFSILEQNGSCVAVAAVDWTVLYPGVEWELCCYCCCWLNCSLSWSRMGAVLLLLLLAELFSILE